MRDENLILHDGTNFTATKTPVSTTRSGGSAVLDIGKTPAKGLWVQAVLKTALAGTTPTIDVKIQYSDSATFASGIEDGPKFTQLTGSTAAGWRQSLLCQSKKRYMRALLTVGGTLTSEVLYVHVASGPDRDDAA